MFRCSSVQVLGVEVLEWSWPTLAKPTLANFSVVVFWPNFLVLLLLWLLLFCVMLLLCFVSRCCYVFVLLLLLFVLFVCVCVCCLVFGVVCVCLCCLCVCLCCLCCCSVVVVVVSCCCGFRRTTLLLTTLRRTAQNFALFLPSPPSFSLVLSLSGGFLVGAAGFFTRQPENSERAHLRALALQTPPKFHEKTPRETQRERNGDGKGRKSAKIWPPPPFRAPLFEPSPFKPPPFEPPLLGSMGPRHLHPPSKSTHTKKTKQYFKKPKQLTSKNQNLYIQLKP